MHRTPASTRTAAGSRSVGFAGRARLNLQAADGGFLMLLAMAEKNIINHH